MKSDETLKTPSGESGLGPTDSRMSDLEEARQEPIPLDVIATELRRQSELRLTEKYSRKPKSGHHGLAARGSGGNESASVMASKPPARNKDDAPLLSRNDLKALMEDQETPIPLVHEPRRSSDVLKDRLIEVRQRAEQAEKQRAETNAQNQELRQQLSLLKDSMENRVDAIRNKVVERDSEEVSALRRELELVHTRAAGDMELLRKQLQDSSWAGDSARNEEMEAELQALRQEAAVLRHAAQEKDKILEDLANQCRGLEDVLEDRDREMDRLNRELEQVQGGEGVSVLDTIPPSVGDASDSRYTYQEKDTSEILDGAGLSYTPSKGRSWKLIAFACATGLLLGLIVAEAAFRLSGRGFSLWENTTVAARLPASSEARVDSVPVSASPAAEPARAVPEFPHTSVPVKSITPPQTKAAPSQSQPKIVQDRLAGGGLGPALVMLPGGSYLMGDKLGVLAKEERPAHQVNLRPFAIGRYEVTFEEYDRFARATGRPLPGDEGRGRGNRPVVNVSWDDAVSFTRWLSQQTGKAYRLPSEAEWEYAGRAASAARYWWGYEGERGRAVCLDCGSRWDNRGTAPVGSLAANPFGLHDTAGNAMEWVGDCYNTNYQGAPTDGSTWLSGDCAQRMVRGGAYNKPLSSLRSSARYRLPQDARFAMLGFRVVRQ